MKIGTLYKKGSIVALLYLFSLAFIMIFGVLYFVPSGGGEAWTLIITSCFFFSIAYAGAYYGGTVWKKLGYLLLFGAISGLFMYIGYDEFALSSQRIDLAIAQMQDPDSSVRASAILSLRDQPIGESTRPRVVEALIDALRDENGTVRGNAALFLGKLGDPMAVDALIEALKDESVWVRWAAIDALGDLGDPRAVEPLITVLEEDESSVVEALRKIGDESAIPSLVNCLLDYSKSEELADALTDLGWQPESDMERVRFYVAQENADELLRIWDETKQVLLQDIDTDKTYCVKYAVCVFVSLGNEEIVPTLVDRLNESDDKNIAEIYLNCGHDGLEDAAGQWAKAHGYYVTHSPGSASAVWGSW